MMINYDKDAWYKDKLYIYITRFEVKCKHSGDKGNIILVPYYLKQMKNPTHQIICKCEKWFV